MSVNPTCRQIMHEMTIGRHLREEDPGDDHDDAMRPDRPGRARHQRVRGVVAHPAPCQTTATDQRCSEYTGIQHLHV